MIEQRRRQRDSCIRTQRMAPQPAEIVLCKWEVTNEGLLCFALQPPSQFDGGRSNTMTCGSSRAALAVFGIQPEASGLDT